MRLEKIPMFGYSTCQRAGARTKVFFLILTHQVDNRMTEFSFFSMIKI